MPVPHDTEKAPMDGVDGARLKQLREAAGWDAKVLAIRVSLSKEQVEQIENGGNGLFYNVSIKRACARKLALALGADPHSVITTLATDLPLPPGPLGRWCSTPMEPVARGMGRLATKGLGPDQRHRTRPPGTKSAASSANSRVAARAPGQPRAAAPSLDIGQHAGQRPGLGLSTAQR